MRYLISIYSRDRQLKAKIRTRQGKGGSPDTLVVEAMNVPGDFDKKLVKADKDRAAEELRKAEALAEDEGIVIVWSKPCIESLLLAILDSKDHSRHRSKTCKNEFEKTYIPADKRTDVRVYDKIFPIEIVEKARPRIKELDILVEFITT